MIFKNKLMLLIILTSIISSSYSQEQIDNNKNYSYSLVLDMNHLSRNNDYNFKFIVNKSWEFSENGAVNFFDNKSIYFIEYEYKKAFHKGFDHYDRIPKDTIKTKLLDYQLDSIFVLTRELMTLDKNINVTEKRKPEVDYDGKYASVKLELFEYSVRKEIVISFDNDFIFQNRFYKLIDFLNSIINKK